MTRTKITSITFGDVCITKSDVPSFENTFKLPEPVPKPLQKPLPKPKATLAALAILFVFITSVAWAQGMDSAVSQEQVFEAITKKAALELSGSYAEGASVVRQFKIGGITEYRKGPLLVTGNVKSWFIESDKTDQDARSGDVEFDWYTSPNRYNGIYISGSQDKPLGEKYTFTDVILTGYDFGNGVWIDGGLAFTRQVIVPTANNADFRIIDWRPSVYVGGNVVMAGIGLKFDFDIGSDRRAGKASITYTEPLGNGLSLKITDDLRYDYPAIGDKPLTSTISTGLVISF